MSLLGSSEAVPLSTAPSGPPHAAEGPRQQKRARLGAAPRALTALPASSDGETDTEACVAFEGEEGLDVSFPLKAVERSFRCSLCNGYFRDAVTIKECLHTFCRWCLYSYVEAGGTEEVCCPFCERNMQLSAPHRDGAGKDSRHYMPRITAACVAAASSQMASAGSGSNNNSSGVAAANAAVLFDRTMQNVVDKLFPHFAAQERLEEEELARYMEQHQQKQLPPEYVTGPLAPGGPFRREALAQRRARLEARAAAEGVLPVLPLDPPHPQEQQQQQQQAHQTSADTTTVAAQRHDQREGLRSSRRHAQQQQQQQPPPLDEFVDQLLGTSNCFDDQQTTAIALLPDIYQGQLMQARLQHQAAQQQSNSSQESSLAGGDFHEAKGLACLPLELPQFDRPYLRVPSRMSVQLVLRYLASQLQPLLFPGSTAGASTPPGNLDGGVAHAQVAGSSGISAYEDQVDLETALELTLEGRVLGRSHSIDFVRKARRLNCAGRCLLLQYRYTAQTETKVVAYHLAQANKQQGAAAPGAAAHGASSGGPSNSSKAE